jgi:hypothetical protein
MYIYFWEINKLDENKKNQLYTMFDQELQIKCKKQLEKHQGP